MIMSVEAILLHFETIFPCETRLIVHTVAYVKRFIPTSSTTISCTVINFHKNIFERFFKVCISYFISFFKKMIIYLYQKDVFFKDVFLKKT